MRKLALSSIVAATILTLAGVSNAAVVYDSNGFESPTFTVGALSGQGGFTNFFPTTSSANWNVDGTRSAPGGVQSVSVSNLGTPAAPVTSFTWRDTNLTGINASPEPIVTVSGSILRPAPETGATNVSTSAAVGIYNIAGSLIAEVGVFNNTATAGAFGTFVPIFRAFNNATPPVLTTFLAGTGATVLPDTWVNFSMELNYVTGTYTASIGGFTTTGIPFITASTDLGDADLTLRGGRGDTSFFDNLRIETSVIPEPTTLALLGAAGVMVLRRKRHA